MAGATFLAQFGKKLIHGLVLLCMTVAEWDSSWLAHGKIDLKFRSAQEDRAPDGLPFDPLLWTLMMMDPDYLQRIIPPARQLISSIIM